MGNSPDRDLTGSTFLVTGATSGIGMSTAGALATRGARVLIGGRNSESVAAAIHELRSARAPDGDIDVSPAVADLADLVAVRHLAMEIMQNERRLDGLVLNAGAASGSSLFTVNVVSGFLLANLLVPLLARSFPSRIVTLSSSQHARISSTDFGAMALDAQTGGADVSYEATKVMAILLARELGRRLPAGITANAADPGFVRTRLGRNATGGFKLLLMLTRPIQATPERGAETSVYLAAAAEPAGTTRGYFSGSRPATPSALASDDAAAARLWLACTEVVTQEGAATDSDLLPEP